MGRISRDPSLCLVHRWVDFLDQQLAGDVVETIPEEKTDEGSSMSEKPSPSPGPSSTTLAVPG